MSWAIFIETGIIAGEYPVKLIIVIDGYRAIDGTKII
jgi:hypothetical protein